MPDSIDRLPDIYGNEEKTGKHSDRKGDLYASISNIAIDKVQSAFGIGLHMHQPIIPAAGGDGLISNLQYMLHHQDTGGNNNAHDFLKCYARMPDIIRGLVAEGRNPRIMLDYSGNLLWGLSLMGEDRVLDKLRLVTSDEKYFQYVEWLGTMWSHAVVSSTPVADIKLHIMAWRKHFASIFGHAALERVKGFSAPEMHLPIHPDICFEYVRALKEAGYEWLAVQEDSIENLDGSPIKRPHFPHRLVARNSIGQVEEIWVLIKRHGADVKLIGGMQPYYEAKSKSREGYCGKNVPLFILQIADGENCVVMMKKFPDAYKKAFNEIGKDGIVGMNGSEYLESLNNLGVDERSFIPVQPVSQHRIWELVKEYFPGACSEAVKKIQEKDAGFNLDRASWANYRSWVKGYEDIIGAINKLSAEFHKRFDHESADKESRIYKETFLYLLLSQTSCFRYWGRGIWTDYAKEIIRRGLDKLR